MPVMEDAFEPRYGEAWSETQLSALLLGPGNWMLVLEVEERICGFAVARSVLDEAELMLIAVPQKMRGRGYGRALLDKVIVECRRRNGRRIYLEVRSDNENAVMLYESAGFRTDMGGASWRERVCQSVWSSVVAVSLKQKENNKRK